jgi:hypothetical protein
MENRAEPGVNFRQRYYKVRVAERMSKDDTAIVDVVDGVAKRDTTVYKTVADVEKTVVNNVQNEVSRAYGPPPIVGDKMVDPNATVINNRLTDRGVLLIAYGALKAVRRSETQGIADIIKSHLSLDKR